MKEAVIRRRRTQLLESALYTLMHIYPVGFKFWTIFHFFAFQVEHWETIFLGQITFKKYRIFLQVIRTSEWECLIFTAPKTRDLFAPSEIAVCIYWYSSLYVYSVYNTSRSIELLQKIKIKTSAVSTTDGWLKQQ